MPNKLFGVDIAGIIKREIGPGVLPAQLIKITQAPRNSANPSKKVAPIEVRHKCKGIVGNYRDTVRGGSLVRAGDRKITLIAGFLAEGVVPEPQDQIFIEGDTYTIVGPVNRDPAGATYTCQVRL